jgi:hypothetical protein
VRKIALTMCAMELESEFLFKPSNKASGPPRPTPL